MRGFEISPDCMIEKTAMAIAKELMKGFLLLDVIIQTSS